MWIFVIYFSVSTYIFDYIKNIFSPALTFIKSGHLILIKALVSKPNIAECRKECITENTRYNILVLLKKKKDFSSHF